MGLSDAVVTATLPYMSPSPEILQAARTAYASGNLIIFGKAGVSTDAGLPSWLALANQARDRSQREGKPGEDIAEANELIERRQLIDALSDSDLRTERRPSVVEGSAAD